MPFKPKYTYDEKLNVCNYYVVEGGNSIKAAKRTGIPAQTIRGWTQTDWWNEMVGEIRRRHQDRLDGKFTWIIDKLHTALLDRVDNGDEIFDTKRGVMVKRAMSGKDITMSLDKIIEKRALLRGDPTSRTSSASPEKQLEQLQKKLEQRTKAMRKKVKESENVEELRKEAQQ